MKSSLDVVATPVGEMFAVIDEDGAVRRLQFCRGRNREEIAADLEADGVDVTAEGEADESVRRQLEEYFGGGRREFELALKPAGTDFERSVWAELVKIPYGQTLSYGEIAARLGRPGASRAVGRANGANPIAIVVPCHRVIGADGSLTGYAGGIDIKERLLRLEGVLPESLF